MQYRKEVKIVTLSGPAGAGKTTIMEKFLSFRLFKAVESYTTRPKRAEEKDVGSKSEYVFISQKEFEQLVQKESFAWHIEYDGYYYGTLKKSLQEALSSKQISVMILTPEIVSRLRAVIESFGGMPEKNIISFFIWAPEEDLESRMIRRGDQWESVSNRLKLVPFQNKKADELGLIKIKNDNGEKPALVFQKMVQEYLLAPPQT